MPEPRKNETEEDYIGRAVSYMIKTEGLSQKHALGKAYGMWRERQKKARTNAKATQVKKASRK